MNKTKNIMLFLLISSLAYSEIKIGYVDSNEIMNNFEEVRQVQVDLEKE